MQTAKKIKEVALFLNKQSYGQFLEAVNQTPSFWSYVETGSMSKTIFPNLLIKQMINIWKEKNEDSSQVAERYLQRFVEYALPLEPYVFSFSSDNPVGETITTKIVFLTAAIVFFLDNHGYQEKARELEAATEKDYKEMREGKK